MPTLTVDHCCEQCIYYAASILGSAIHAQLPTRYFFELIERGALDVLVPLLAGTCSWLEQRLAVRCLHHLACDERCREAIVKAGVVPMLAHFGEHALPVALRQNLVKRNRAPMGHVDLIAGMSGMSAMMMDDGDAGYREALWKQVDMAESYTASAVDSIARSPLSASGALAVTEPGVLRVVVMWLLAQPFKESPLSQSSMLKSMKEQGDGAWTDAELRLSALDLLRRLCNSHPLISPATGRPVKTRMGVGNVADSFAVGGKNDKGWREDTSEPVFPSEIVMPEDVETAQEVARRLCAAGIHRYIVILAYEGECEAMLNYCLRIIGGLAIEPSCRQQLALAGALPVLLAGVDSNMVILSESGKLVDRGWTFRKACVQVFELICSEAFADPAAEEERGWALRTLERLRKSEYSDKEARVAAFQRGCEVKAEGNALFKQRKFAEARGKYEEALTLLPWMPPRVEPSPSTLRYLKERAAALSNCAETCIRMGDDHRAIFYATCAMWHNGHAAGAHGLHAKSGARRLRAVHSLLSRRDKTGLRQHEWFPEINVDATGRFAPACLGAAADDDERQRMMFTEGQNHDWCGGAFCGLSSDPSLMWLVVMSRDTMITMENTKMEDTDDEAEMDDITQHLIFNVSLEHTLLSRRLMLTRNICTNRIERVTRRRVARDASLRFNSSGSPEPSEFTEDDAEERQRFVRNEVRRFTFFDPDKDFQSEDSFSEDDEDSYNEPEAMYCAHNSPCSCGSMGCGRRFGFMRWAPHPAV